MIACEICGNYFHVDDIQECSKCGIELCPECAEKHISKCIVGEDNNNDYEEDNLIPSECPKCGEELELDIDYDKQMLFCTNRSCDYSLDVTNEMECLMQEDSEEE